MVGGAFISLRKAERRMKNVNQKEPQPNLNQKRLNSPNYEGW
jgi:hypothetical protein